MRSNSVRQLGYFLLGLAIVVALADSVAERPGTLFGFALTLSIAGAALSLHRPSGGNDVG